MHSASPPSKRFAPGPSSCQAGSSLVSVSAYRKPGRTATNRNGKGPVHDVPANLQQQPPTIYDVAREAGVSIASVSRVLNGHRNPRQETRDRVLQAVAELGFVPDGAARALSARLKEVVGVVFRRVPWGESHEGADGAVTEEDESLQFTDVINRGIEVAAQRRGYNLLVGSVDVDGHDAHRRVMTMARKCDGLILHDRVLEPSRLAQLSRQVPIVK